MLRSIVLVGALVLLMVVANGAAATEPRSATAFVRSVDPIVVEVMDGKHYGGCAIATYSDTINSTGWANLEITTMPTSKGCSDTAQAVGAGVLESYFTHERMYQYWQNYAANEYGSAGPSSDLRAWMAKQLAWVKTQIAGNSTTLWSSGMRLLMAQFSGLVSGYTKYASADQKMLELDIYMLNSVGDLEDLNTVFKTGVSSESAPQPQRPRVRGVPGWEKDELMDCSGLVKILENNADIICGQTTWRSYYAMLRVYKIYRLSFADNTISFSSSPGLLHSKDDFYATSQGLIVQETTNAIFDKTLYDLLTPHSLLSWQRVTVGNVWARSGTEWISYFSDYNSGTYNNQWMVLDRHLFTPGQALPANLFWIAEQIPGTIETLDVSSHLDKERYWPSYNIPYIEDIYDMSGYPAMKEKHGDAYSYENCPRAKIFARNQSSLLSLDDVRGIMQYNHWQDDPLALGNPLNQISSRGDINCSVPGYKPVPFGGIDSKVASFLGVKADLTVHAISGPSHTYQQPFKWDPTWSSVAHDGVPAVFDFDWVAVAPSY